MTPAGHGSCTRALSRGTLFSLLVAASAVCHAQEGDYAAKYSCDFEGEAFDNLALAPLGKKTITLMRPSENGLAIHVPSGKEIKPVGFSPKFKIRGDFKITMSYEVQEWSCPKKKGAGVGPSLYVVAEGPGPPAAELSRVRRADKGDVYSAYCATFVDGERRGATRWFPTEVLQGRLQMQRKGDTLSFSASEGLEAEFEPLGEASFSQNDVSILRIAVKQGGPEAAADVVIRDLTVFADELPHLPNQGQTEPFYRPTYHPPPPRSFWARWRMMAIVCAALVGCVLAVVLVRRAISNR